MEMDEELNMLQSMKEKYSKAQKLSNDRAIRDSNDFCEVINILKELIEEINTKVTSLTEPKNKTAMLATSHAKLGEMYADSDKTDAAEEHFLKCTDLLKDKELEPENILAVITALNHLGIIYAQCSESAKAKVFLEKAQKLYIEFTENLQLAPINVFAVGTDVKEVNVNSTLMKLHTFTLYYLAQVYNALDDKERFAEYCHKTLSMQLSLIHEDDNIHYIDWALNAATLSQYFIGHDNFTQARYHLAAASYMMEKHQSSLKEEPSGNNEFFLVERENFRYRSADVARCWAKYGIALLSASKERLLKSVEEEDQSDDSNPPATEVTKPTAELMRFVDIEPELEAIAGQVTDQYLLDFEDARPVFLNVQKWLDKAKAYYTLDNHASDYARIVQDISQAFMYLSFYEVHEDRQAKMHKRRIDVLERVIKRLNPQYYSTICREIWIELAKTYSEIMNIKIDRLQASDEKPTAQMITKINQLVKGSIKHFRSYVDSLESGKSDDGIPKYSDDQVYQALYTHFLIGRLYTKIMTSDLKSRIENMQNALDAYQFVVSYCDKYPEKTEALKKHEFINLCTEFAGLLPLTLHRLRQQLIDE